MLQRQAATSVRCYHSLEKERGEREGVPVKMCGVWHEAASHFGTVPATLLGEKDRRVFVPPPEYLPQLEGEERRRSHWKEEVRKAGLAVSFVLGHGAGIRRRNSNALSICPIPALSATGEPRENSLRKKI